MSTLREMVRAPQQARSHATRGRLVEAAAGCLVELGFAGASTAVVAQRAEVSQGALFKHFPSKPQLLAACVERILAGFVAEFREHVAGPQGQGTSIEERIGPAVAALWRIFRRPEMHAVFEVYVAARTDAPLAAALAPILERHREHIMTEARRLFPELPAVAAAEQIDAAVDAIVYAMQGVVLGLFAPLDARTEEQHLRFFERLARREIEHALPRPKGKE